MCAWVCRWRGGWECGTWHLAHSSWSDPHPCMLPSRPMMCFRPEPFRNEMVVFKGHIKYHFLIYYARAPFVCAVCVTLALCERHISIHCLDIVRYSSCTLLFRFNEWTDIASGSMQLHFRLNCSHVEQRVHVHRRHIIVKLIGLQSKVDWSI